MSGTPRPRRLIAACHPCHKHKTRCSGEQPCVACVSNGRANDCEFPRRERKIPVPEGYLRQLEADSKRLRESATSSNHSSRSPRSRPITPGPSQIDDDLRLSHEESTMVNPLFDGQREAAGVKGWSAGDTDFIGEASCAAFSDRLLQCFDETYIPAKAGFSNYHPLNGPRQYSLSQPDREDFPERIHAKLLLNVARRFIGNYHPLFLESTFMREMDAVYRRETVPSPLWLCKFYTLMSLGEVYSNRRGSDGLVPGTRYYEHAVYMFQDHDLHEEPQLIHVEILTLLGWASNIFGRIRTAYHYSGVAIRLAMSMGMHRSALNTSTLTPVERESRRRTWWVLYFFDRFSASKLGQPVGVRDEDIDVEMPSMDGLTEEEKGEFLDPVPLVTNTKLGRIIGNILTDIYGVPKSRRGHCIRGVHRILKQLRSWHDELPPDLRVRKRGTPRTVASLHLAYNQCIIQTTRPVLLHLFKTQFHLGSIQSVPPDIQRQKAVTQQRHMFSPITLALAESCVNAARSTSRIVESLFLDGAIASYGYWDAHHIFSAALILIISAVMKPTSANSEALETLLSILRSIKNDGNIPAVDFCDRVSQVKARVFTLRQKMQPSAPVNGSAIGDAPRSDDPKASQQALVQMLTTPVSTITSPSSPSLGEVMHAKDSQRDHGVDSTMATPQDPTSFDWPNTAVNDVLANPLIGSFLDEARMLPYFAGESITFSPSEEGAAFRQFAFEMETHFSLF